MRLSLPNSTRRHPIPRQQIAIRFKPHFSQVSRLRSSTGIDGIDEINERWECLKATVLHVANADVTLNRRRFACFKPWITWGYKEPCPLEEVPGEYTYQHRQTLHFQFTKRARLDVNKGYGPEELQHRVLRLLAHFIPLLVHRTF